MFIHICQSPFLNRSAKINANRIQKNLTSWHFPTSCNQRYCAQQLTANPLWIKVVVTVKPPVQGSLNNLLRIDSVDKSLCATKTSYNRIITMFIPVQDTEQYLVLE